MNTAWIYPFILLGGMLQTCGAAMNAQLFHSLENKWLANVVSFALILAFFVGVFTMFPHPLPNSQNLSNMPWWAPLGGLVGAVQVYAGLTLVQKVGGPLRRPDSYGGAGYLSPPGSIRVVSYPGASSEHPTHCRSLADDRWRCTDRRKLNTKD